jgi:hypothetical protein
MSHVRIQKHYTQKKIIHIVGGVRKSCKKVIRIVVLLFFTAMAIAFG